MALDLLHGLKTYDLAGGARAFVKPRSSVPLVTIAIAARGGSHEESPDNAGLTGLLGRTSVKGTASRTALQIAEQAEAMGGSVSPSIGSDMLDWEISVPARHFDAALELLADVALHASFPDAEFAVEKKLALADLQQTRDDMYRYPVRLCLQQAFKGHAYGRTIGDVERTLSTVTPDKARAWHDHLMRAPWFFVVGDIDAEAAARAIESISVVSSPSPAPSPSDVASWGGPARQSETRDKAQSAIALAFPGPDRNNEDAYTLQVLANAVGGLGGRFFEELRSKRSLAYTVSLMPVARNLGGAFLSYIATSPEREDEARSALLEQFDRLRQEALPAEEVSRAQRYTIGSWQIRSQTNGAQLADIMHAYMLGEGASEITEFEKRIMAVTPESILAAARRYFDPALAVEGTVRGERKGNV